MVRDLSAGADRNTTSRGVRQARFVEYEPSHDLHACREGRSPQAVSRGKRLLAPLGASGSESSLRSHLLASQEDKPHRGLGVSREQPSGYARRSVPPARPRQHQSHARLGTNAPLTRHPAARCGSGRSPCSARQVERVQPAANERVPRPDSHIRWTPRKWTPRRFVVGLDQPTTICPVIFGWSEQ